IIAANDEPSGDLPLSCDAHVLKLARGKPDKVFVRRCPDRFIGKGEILHGDRIHSWTARHFRGKVRVIRHASHRNVARMDVNPVVRKKLSFYQEIYSDVIAISQ